MRWLISGTVLIVAFWGGVVVLGQAPGLLVTKFGKSAELVEGGASRTYFPTLQQGQKGRVLVIGDGSSYLGAYVYDKDGNCVGRDDDVDYAVKDDLAINWLATQSGTYCVEVKSFGRVKNSYELAIESSKYDAKADLITRKPDLPDQQPLAIKDKGSRASRREFDPDEKLAVRKFFRGGARACVIARGKHKQEMAFDIQVIDENNKLIVHEAPGHDFCSAIWYPPRDGDYTIVIHNLSQEKVDTWLVFK
jgi:hypothetical protein